MAPEQIALRVLAEHLEDVEILRDDDVAFHAQHFGDVGDAARAVAQTCGLYHYIDR